jgi:hypothetical protein
MSHKIHFAGKHGQDRKIDPAIAEMVKERASEGKLACAVAFNIARALDVKPSEVGVMLDLLEIKIAKCQMGIFGYGKDNKFIKPMEDVPALLENAIREGFTDGKLTCSSAWIVADRLSISRMDIASACDRLGIKISSCQLGAF